MTLVPPPTDGPAWGFDPPAQTPRSEYRPIGRLTAWVVGLLLAVIMVDIIDLGLSWVGVHALGGIGSAPGPVNGLLYERLGAVEIAAVAIGLATVLVTGIVFLVWFHRTYRNLAALDRSLSMRFRTGWAIGAWFTPFLNLVRPAAIAHDIWHGTDPAAPVGSTGGESEREHPPLLGLWWAAFLATNTVGRYLIQGFATATTRQDLLSAYRWAMLGDAIDIVAAFLAVVVVLRLSQRQRERAALLAAADVLPRTFAHPDAA